MTLSLNRYQEAFVAWDPADGNLRVQAAAGSGKSLGLVEFIARQLDLGVPPEAIVVVTFTNKAATEIRSRIIERMGRPVDGMRVGTFHALALAALRGSEDCWRYGSNTLLDGSGVPVEGQGLVNAMKLWRLVLGRGPVPGTGGQGLKLSNPDAFEYSGWADRFAASKMHPGWVLENGKGFDEITQLERFTAAWSTFERAKRAMKAWQFSDCLSGWLLLLRRRGKGILGTAPQRDGPPERSGIGPWDPLQGHLVVVDEVQDNSLIQWELARRIATPEGRLVCVGDARQCQPAGTKVATPGGEVPIETLRDGDEVLGWRLVGGDPRMTSRRVCVVVRDYSGLLYTIQVGDRRTQATENHRWQARRGLGPWDTFTTTSARLGSVAGCQVPAGNGLYRWGEVSVRAERVTNLPVYSLDVEIDHAYIADGICTKNSIYGWRGAKLDLFLQADAALEARTLDLPVNYRSRRRIVGLGNAIVRGTDWALGAEGQAATAEAGEILLRNFETPEDEALDVVRAVRQDLAQGVPARQIAVLTRTNTYALRAAVMLGLYGIPISMLGRRSLLSLPEVGAFLGWVIASEEGATVPGPILSAMCNAPQSFLPRPLKDKLAEAVAAQGLDAGLAATRRLATEVHHKRAFDGFRTRLDHLREHTWPAVLPAAATLVGGAADPDKKKQKEDAARNRVDPALAEYVAGTRDEDPDGKALGLLWVLSSLGEFFPDVRAFAAALARVDTQMQSAGEGVSVGTAHSCKSLEWDVVYGLGVAQGVFPSPMARTERDFDEERRLLYVLSTRPRRRLQLSWSESIYRAGKLIAGGPSSLIVDYVQPALEADEQATVYVDPGELEARRARTLEVVAEGIRVGLDVGVAEGVRAGMVAGVGAMVRAALAPDVEGEAASGDGED